MRLTTAAAITGMSLPVGYLVKKHVDWETKPDSKKRMLIYHGVFWSSAALALRFVHDSFRKIWQAKRAGTPIPTAFAVSRLIAAGLLPIAGFEGGLWIGRKLIPKKPAPTLPGKRPAYVPSYLKQSGYQTYA